jgi:hypothetical protein
MKPLSTAWTQHLSGKDKDDFEVIVRNSTLLLTRLKEIIEESERALHSQSHSVSDFSDPNWSHKQAFRNGELARLKKMKDLIPF